MQGRTLAHFPNILQHKVETFQLADATKKGHRKILALFLVDPGIRIISTANVPPQQKHWCSDEVTPTLAKDGYVLAKLPLEIREKIFKEVNESPIGMDEAKDIRLK